MKNILARNGIEFSVVFFGIVLSLWVDHHRQSRRINIRLFDDYQKIYSEVKSNIQNINKITKKNKNTLITERYLLDVVDGKKSYKQNEIYGKIYSINWLVDTDSQLLKVDKVFKNYFASNSI